MTLYEASAIKCGQTVFLHGQPHEVTGTLLLPSEPGSAEPAEVTLQLDYGRWFSHKDVDAAAKERMINHDI